MDKQPILSLCIPTNGAVEWILPVIESIYSQGYDNEKFEVVITDNGKDSQLPEHIAKMSYPNLHYKQTTDEGFLNLVTSLKEGKGLFCKMINHRSVMLPGSIEDLVELVNLYAGNQPIIYCACGNAKTQEIKECKNLDDFLAGLSYWASWSAGIGFWRKDISHFEKIELDEMFPNASLLFGVRDCSEYVIWNKKYMLMEDDAGKGGYDLFQTFGVGFLDIINELRIHRRISQKTFLNIKSDLSDFLNSHYLSEVLMPTKHTFIIGDVRNSICVYYSIYDYYEMLIKAWLKAPNSYLRLLLVRMLSPIFKREKKKV